MMTKLTAVLAVLLAATPALANQTHRYTATCYLESAGTLYRDECVVIDTRTSDGALHARNIFSNRFGLTIKGRFKQGVGYVTWDSHNQREYKWEYKVGRVEGSDNPYSYVMPGILVENIPWD